MILDACRNNPLATRVNRSALGGTRSGEAVRGLARIDKSEGMVVAYATAADNVAMDGAGRNSPFTTALVNRMREPGLEVEMMFRRVTADVNAATNGRQRPETYISLLSEYYLNQSDRLAWDRIKDQDDPEALRDFIKRFPSSIRTIDARRRVELLAQFAEERRREQNKAAEAQRLAAEREAVRRREEAERQRMALDEAEKERRIAEERRQRQEQDKAAELQRLAAAPEAVRRREEAERQKIALDEAEKERRIAEERRQRQEQDKAAELQRLAAAREVAQRLEEAERQKAALEAREAEKSRKIAAERAEEERARNLAEAARRLAEEETARRAQAALKAEERERTRVAVPTTNNITPPTSTPPLVGDQPPYQVATVTPTGSPQSVAGEGSATSGNPIVDVQRELARLGCFSGNVTGVQDAATKKALESYLKSSGQTGPIGALDAVLVAHLRLHESRVCPLHCPTGTLASAGSCIAAPQKPAAPKAAAPKAAPPKAAPPKVARPSTPPRPRAAPVQTAAPAARPQPPASSNRSVTGVGF